MSTPTGLSAASGSVLTHPAFDRPPVHNERRPGPKKGTLSMAAARRHRIWVRDEAEREAKRSAASTPRVPGAARSAVPVPELAHPLATPRDSLAAARPFAPPRQRHEDAVIGAALAIIEERIRVPMYACEKPHAVKDYLRLHLAELDREVFGVMFLDTHLRLIAFEVLFEGTLAHTSVHPREVARRALQLNAAAVILAHNHPSGVAEPSRADVLLTQGLREALQLIDVRVVDHVIVGEREAMSFAERGLM